MKVSPVSGLWKSILSLRRHAHRPLAERLMHMTHKSGNTSRVWSHHRIGWIIQDFRETCVSRSLPFRLETKMPWRQTPSRKKKAVVFTTVMMSAYQGQINAGFSKVCEIFKVHGIESLKYVREFYTPVCYRCDISTPWNVMLNETNCDWLCDMSVKRPHGRALANKSCDGFQTVSLKVWLRETSGRAEW